MARQGGGITSGGGIGGGRTTGPSLPRRGRGGAVNGGLPAAGGGGGARGPHRPNRPNRPQHQGGGGSGKDDGSLTDPPADTSSGPGSTIFNSEEGGVAGITGLASQGGVNFNSGNPYMDSWANDQAQAMFNDYDAQLTAGTHGANWTLTDYLNGQFGQPAGGVGAPGPSLGNDKGVGGGGAGGTLPTTGKPGGTGVLPAALAAYYRQKWNSLNPTARNYFSENWTGPGRVIAG